jgi:hypothetical protein
MDASGALKFVKNRIEMRKLQPPQRRGGQELKKNKPLNTTQASSQPPSTSMGFLLRFGAYSIIFS